MFKEKLTGKEMFALFALSMAGIFATTLVAWYYPDYPNYITYAGIASVVMMAAVGFLITRQKTA